MEAYDGRVSTRSVNTEECCCADTRKGEDAP